jgi:hypothetical protein
VPFLRVDRSRGNSPLGGFGLDLQESTQDCQKQKKISWTSSPKGVHGTFAQGAPFIVLPRSAPLQSKSVRVAFPFGYAPAHCPNVLPVSLSRACFGKRKFTLSEVRASHSRINSTQASRRDLACVRGGKACALTQLETEIFFAHSREPQRVLWAVCLDREVCFHPHIRTHTHTLATNDWINEGWIGPTCCRPRWPAGSRTSPSVHPRPWRHTGVRRTRRTRDAQRARRRDSSTPHERPVPQLAALAFVYLAAPIGIRRKALL